MEYDFKDPPAIGHSYVRASGQRYELIEVQPYVRRLDKAPSFLLTWRSQCLTCGGDFEVTAGMKTNGINRRCDLHKSPMAVTRAHIGQNQRSIKREAPAAKAEPWQEGLHSLKRLASGAIGGRYGRKGPPGEVIRFHWRKGAEGEFTLLDDNPEDRALLEGMKDEIEAAWIAADLLE